MVVSVSTQRLVVRPDTTIMAQLAGSSPATSAPESTKPLVPDIPDPFAE
jgi:hypothetical protein